MANTHFFTYYLYFGVKVTQNAAQYLLHNVTYVLVKFEVTICPMVKEEMHIQANTLYDLDPDLEVKETQNVVQYPPNHMTYAPAKFDSDRNSPTFLPLEKN